MNAERYQLLFALDQIDRLDEEIYCTLFHVDRTCRIWLEKNMQYSVKDKLGPEIRKIKQITYYKCKVCQQNYYAHYAVARFCWFPTFAPFIPFFLYWNFPMLLLPSVQKVGFASLSISLKPRNAIALFQFILRLRINSASRRLFTFWFDLCEKKILKKDFTGPYLKFRTNWAYLTSLAHKSAWKPFFENKSMAHTYVALHQQKVKKRDASPKRIQK